MTASLATIACYFRVGLEIRLFHPDQTRDWALSVIGSMDQPPAGIIEVSWQKPLAQLIADLKEVEGDADADLACSALLGTIGERLQSGKADFETTLFHATMITSMFSYTGCVDRLDTFHGIDDRLQLAMCGYFGTVEECREDFDNAMKDYASAPLAL